MVSLVQVGADLEAALAASGMQFDADFQPRGEASFTMKACLGNRNPFDLTDGVQVQDKYLFVVKRVWDLHCTRPPRRGDKVDYQNTHAGVEDVKLDGAGIAYQLTLRGGDY